MSKGSVSQANAAMAKYLAEKGVRRTTLACSLCHRVVGINNYQDHLLSCKGR
jgi:hypothetical protein